MILIFDTETTGLPPSRLVSPHDTETWNRCRMVQIAWELYDASTQTLVEAKQFICKPDGYVIPFYATQIHGISTAMATETGVDVQDVLAAFQEAVEKASTIVAHNISFDERVIHAEFARAGRAEFIDNVWSEKTKQCTMRMGTPPKQKWPKLVELYQRLFGEMPTVTLHRADADVAVCAKCYFKLIEASTSSSNSNNSV